MIVVSQIICIIGILIGFALFLYGVYEKKRQSECIRIDAEIVDYTQEYNARGFGWRAKLQYEFNGKERFYYSRSRTTNRENGTMKIYVDKKTGKAFEGRDAIRHSLLGILFIVVSTMGLAGIPNGTTNESIEPTQTIEEIR